MLHSTVSGVPIDILNRCQSFLAIRRADGDAVATNVTNEIGERSWNPKIEHNVSTHEQPASPTLTFTTTYSFSSPLQWSLSLMLAAMCLPTRGPLFSLV